MEFGEDCGSVIFVNSWQDMGGCHDGSYPVLITDPAHLDGVLNGLGPIIQIRQDMGMDVDHQPFIASPPAVPVPLR